MQTATSQAPTFTITPANWVKPKMLMPLFGMSPESARKKRERGIWLEGKHWRDVKNEGIMYNWREIDNLLGTS